MTLMYGLPLDMERPSMATMLAPTLAQAGARWRFLAYDGHPAIIAVGDHTDDELTLAVGLHAVMQRGLLVIL